MKFYKIKGFEVLGQREKYNLSILAYLTILKEENF